MVSLLNNAGIRLCFSKDAQLPQYPYSYLPDNYQNHMNSPNLLYSQPPPEAEPKKTKTSKKKAENDKNARENSSLLECTKEDLIIWLNSLTLEERFEAFSIKNPWLAVAFVKMYKKWSESRDTIFRLLPEENPLNTDKSNASFGDFDNHFYFRSSVTGKMPHIIKIEEILIQNVRIYDDNNLYNMIAFKDDLLQDMDQVIKMFNIISNDKAFTKPCQSVSDHKNSTNVTVDKPTWFKPNEFATLAEWIVGSFEKAIWTKYLQNKKAPNKYSSAFEALDSKVTLSYKRSLVEFWTGLEKSKKKKIVSTANETFKWLNSSDSEQKSSDNGREINQGLRKLYEGPLFAQSKESTTAENINAYFTQLMEEKNDETVIETILMTSLFQFGTISNLICRKLAHKLRNMLSEKIASDLILNEEREKKNSTKKKSKKKKAKKPAQQNDAKDTNKADGSKAERIDCVGTTEEDDIQIEDITYEEEEKKPQINITKIVNNNPIPEKEAPKVNTLVGPVANNTKNKKNKQAKEKAKAAEEVKVVEVQDHKPEEKTEKLEEAKTETRKNSQIDPWQQFDEFDKKISKSQKRKLKKKQKNLEKEKLNGEEELEKETETDKMEEEPIPEDNKENDNVVNKPREEKEAKENIVNIPETKNLQTKAPETTKEQKRDNRSNENKKKNNAERRNNDASVKNAESQSLPTTPLLSKTESITKNLQKEEPASAKIVPATQVDDSEFGFIEVKAKKKLEKEPPQKERRDREAKGAGRRKKQKEEAETKKPAKNTRRPKSPLPPTEMKKESSEIRSTKGTERSAPIVKCVVTEVTHKNNVGIPKVILGPAVSSKATTTKASKKEPVDEKLEGSSNSSEGEGTPCNTRNTSHTSRSSHNPQRSPNETNIDNTSEQKNANNNAKNHRGHPLSLASPSLDLETIKVAQAKDYANKYFNKKFENDVYKYVSSLTDEANKMTDYRIIAFRRLDHCITSLFPNFNVQTKIFGSCATGLALTSSDIDISVSGLEAYDRFALGDYLLLISNALNQFKWVTSNDPILTASVPILKLEIDLRAKYAEVKENQTPNKLFDIPMDNKDDLNVDIPADRDDLKIRVDLSLESLGMGYNYHLGYKTTAFVQRMLGKYESLYIVTMVLKQFLFTRRLLNIYKGGVSSYCLVIMIVALLQKFGDEGYMTTLKRFFSYYGEVFKPETTGISLIDKDPFFPLGHSYETAPFWIIVDNNFNRKNIGGGVYSIKVILHEFANAFHTIETIRKKLEETAAKNHQLVQSIDDISKLELDQDIQTMLKSNLLELIINNSELISQGE